MQNPDREVINAAEYESTMLKSHIGKLRLVRDKFTSLMSAEVARKIAGNSIWTQVHGLPGHQDSGGQNLFNTSASFSNIGNWVLLSGG